MNDDPLDLSPIDPTRDTERFEQMVAAIRFRSEAVFVRRRRRPTILDGVAGWWTPALAAAAVIAAASAVSWIVALPASAQQSVLAEATGVPAAVADWAQTDATPSPGELLVSLGGTQ